MHLRWQVTAVLFFIAALAWPYAPHPVIASWLVAAVALREWRSWHLRRLSVDGRTDTDRLRRRVILDMALIGAGIGASAVFMWWMEATVDALLTMILVSLTAAATSTTGLLLPAYLAFSAAVLLPAAAMWLVGGTPLGMFVGLLIPVLLRLQYRFARESMRVFEESFEIRQERDKLVLELAAERDRAEFANQAKSRFLAAASHDLRQPLHALSLLSAQLAQRPGAPEAGALAQELSSSIESLGELLDSLLDITKLDAGVVEVDRRPIVLQRLLDYVAKGARPQAALKGVSLRVECPSAPVVNTDPQLLERLLRNLIDNAVKYTDQGEVLVRVLPQADCLRVSIADTGRGIPPESLARVFDEFYQVPDTGARGHARGLGLGLAIVQRLATLLGLRIALESRLGEGTTVSFTIDATAPAAAPAPVAEVASERDLAGLTVLVIDDDEQARRATRRAVESFGCRAVEAVSTKDALQVAASAAPDLLLADFDLGEGDTGLAAVRRLRESQPALPALLISGNTEAKHRREAEQAGLQLLRKPATLKGLRTAISSVLPPR
jgi:signal transduction histidine kinase